MESKRITYLDLTKLWAIFLVCMGHTFGMLSVGEGALPCRMLYTFHMGLFVLMCGFFSHHSLSMPFAPFIKKKTLQLLLPTAVYVCLNILATCLVAGSCPMDFMRNEAIGGMWFLRTLFACYVYVWLVLRLPGAVWLKGMLSIVVALLFPHGYFLQFNYMLIFFWMGYALKGREHILRKSLGVVFVASLMVYLNVPWQEPQVLTYDVLFHHPLQLPIQLAGGLGGALLSLAVIYFHSQIFGGGWCDKLAKMGRYTLAIYGLQGVLLQNVVERLCYIDARLCSPSVQEFFVAPLIAATMVWICYAIARLMERNKITAMLFLGTSPKPSR